MEPKEERKYLLKGAQLLSNNVLTFTSSLLALGVMNEFSAYFKVTFLGWLVLFNKMMLVEIALAALAIRFLMYFLSRASRQHFRTAEDLFNEDELKKAFTEKKSKEELASDKEALRILKDVEKVLLKKSTSLIGTEGNFRHFKQWDSAWKAIKIFNERFPEAGLMIYGGSEYNKPTFSIQTRKRFKDSFDSQYSLASAIKAGVVVLEPKITPSPAET